MMIYLSILLLLLLLLMPIIHNFFKPLDIYTQIRLEREAALFFRHTEIEVNEALKYDVKYSDKPNNADELIFHIEDDTLTYWKHGHKILRKKSSQPRGGNLEMAHFVKEFHFSRVNANLFQISLTLEDNGIEYTVKRLMGLKVNQQQEEIEEALEDE